MNAIYAERYYVFTTDHFSTYILANLESKDDINYGDANGDGIVNSADAVLIKKYLAGYKDLEIDEKACDVNIDGAITSADAVLILKYLAGYEVVFDE